MAKRRNANAAYERARDVILADERTVLNAEERDAFLAALEKPAAPTDELLRALESHNARVVADT